MNSRAKRCDFELMSIDELWALHGEIATKVAARMTSEKRMLEERLMKLNQSRPSEHKILRPSRRPYPTVVPKYQNTDEPWETWSGRGRQPRWLVAQLKMGKQIDDFRIQRRATLNRGRAREAANRLPKDHS
jgi:DNA-binding protein H-NS